MTPAEEIECVIKEIAAHKNGGISTYYTIKSFPEIYIMKLTSYYTVLLKEDCYKNEEIVKIYKEFVKEFVDRKIIIENHILDIDRNIVFHVNSLTTSVPIYYKGCVFTDPYTLIGMFCENCTVEK